MRLTIEEVTRIAKIAGLTSVSERCNTSPLNR